MNKKILLILLLVLSFITLTGCRKDIPEGDIKNLVESFNIDNAMSNILYGSSTVTSVHYEDGIELGQITTYTYIDRRNGYYHYSKTTLSGNYYGTGEDQFNYYEQETISYIDSEGLIIAFEKTDGIVKEVTYRREDIDTLINYFYYTNSEYNYYKGGVYYGDYIRANCAKYYELFSLNEEKNILSFEVNSISKAEDKQEILTMHKYSVNEFGMILDLSTWSMYKEHTETNSKTTMTCDYNDNFNKIYNFD